ncbi:MAG: hypothetical protein QGI09_02470, partial [Dehalococcoidia bacterium]|nr:hypothetical protein [Dehalococcoidia bacterium]
IIAVGINMLPAFINASSWRTRVISIVDIIKVGTEIHIVPGCVISSRPVKFCPVVNIFAPHSWILIPGLIRYRSGGSGK